MSLQIIIQKEMDKIKYWMCNISIYIIFFKVFKNPKLAGLKKSRDHIKGLLSGVIYWTNEEKKEKKRSLANKSITR